MGKGSPCLRVPSPSEFAATQKYSAFAAPTPETILCKLLANYRPASTTNSRLTSTGRGGNTDWFANVRKGRKRNPALYHFDLSGRRERFTNDPPKFLIGVLRLVRLSGWDSATSSR